MFNTRITMILVIMIGVEFSIISYPNIPSPSQANNRENSHILLEINVISTMFESHIELTYRIKM